MHTRVSGCGLMPHRWIKPGTKVKVRQFEDETAYEYNRRLKKGWKPTPIHLWRVEDMEGDLVTQAGYCVSRQAAVDSAHRLRLSVIDDEIAGSDVA
jgi:hypothetical protein